MKKVLFGALSLMLLVSSCSKDKDETPDDNSIDLSLLSKVQYWKVDSTVQWLDGTPYTFYNDHVDNYDFYNFSDTSITVVKLDHEYYSENTLEYTTENGNFELKYSSGMRFEVRELTPTFLKWSQINEIGGSGWDSLVHYVTPSNQTQWESGRRD